jgi:hypothetical protein
MNCAAEMREAPLGLLAPPETPPTTIFRPLQLRCRFHSLFSSGSAFRKISVAKCRYPKKLQYTYSHRERAERGGANQRED